MTIPRIDRLDHNFLINGAMDFPQRIGANVVAANGTPTYYMDRWLMHVGGGWTGSPTIEQAVDLASIETKYVSKIASANAVNVTSWIRHTQRIESINARNLAGETVSLSLRYRGQSFRKLTLTISTPDIEDDFSAVTTVDTVVKSIDDDNASHVITFPNIAIPSGATRGLQVEFMTDDNSIIATNFEWNFSEVKLNIGTTAQEFSLAGRNVIEELSLCQRYFEKSYNIGTAPGAITTGGMAVSLMPTNGSSTFFVPLKVVKRVNVIAATYNRATGTLYEVRQEGDNSNRSSAILGEGESGFTVNVPTGFATYTVTYHWIADAEL